MIGRTNAQSVSAAPGPTPGVELFNVTVFDYDGTILKEADLPNGATFEMPTPPSHQNLVFEGWSCSQEIVNNVITINNNNVTAGPMYHTASGYLELDIDIPNELEYKRISFTVQNLYTGSLTIDWGDSTTTEVTSNTVEHIYTNGGQYTIVFIGNMNTAPAMGYSSNQDTFLWKKFIVEARLPNTVTKIGNDTNCDGFIFCSNLKRISMSSSVISLTSSAFKSCTNLESAIIPNTVTNIKDRTFGSDLGLSNVVIPKGITNIGHSSYGEAFYNCGSLKNIAIPTTVTTLKISTFAGCSSLTKVILPSSVTTLGETVFSNCTSLVEIKISSNLTDIGNSCFNNCTSLLEIELPQTMNSLGHSIFKDCKSIKKITMPTTVTTFNSQLYYMFYNCNKLEEVNIPNCDTLTTTSNYSFYACRSLKKITNFPSTITTIGQYAFQMCSISSQYIPDTITTVQKYGFSESGIGHIPSAITSLADYSFYFCNKLYDGTIPSGVTIIPQYMFGKALQLDRITCLGNVTQIKSYAFSDSTAVRTFDFTHCTSVPTLQGSAFPTFMTGKQILVPASLEAEWKAASGWSSYANYIVGV